MPSDTSVVPLWIARVGCSASRGRLLSLACSWLTLASATTVQAAPVLPGDTLLVTVFIRHTDAVEASETDEYLVLESSGGYRQVLPNIAGRTGVSFAAKVPGETVWVSLVNGDGDEIVNYYVKVVSSISPPPPPPAPPVPPPPAPLPPPPSPPPTPPFDPDANAGAPSCRAKTGNPVHTLTGNKFTEAVDVKGGGAWPLGFARYYNSSPWNTRLKPGWHHSYEFTADLHLTGVADGSSWIDIHMPDGRTVRYSATAYTGGNYVWASTADLAGKLVSKAGVYSYVASDNTVYSFLDRNTPNVGGVVAGSTPVVAIQKPSGYAQNLAYQDLGTLALPDLSVYMQVSDSFGRTLQLLDDSTIDTVGDRQPHTVILPDSEDYGYKLLFANIKNPIGWYPYSSTFDTYPYGPRYLYGEVSLAPANLPYALTGIVDANGDRFANYGYEAGGKAILTEHAGHAGKATLAFNSDGTTTVTTSLGFIVHSRTLVNGLALSGGQQQPQGAGCMAAMSQIAYDTKGNVVSEDDFNGHRTCYQNDGRNLRTVSVEGLLNAPSCPALLTNGVVLPTGSRKISTQWHPDWRLPTRIAEPTRLTTIVYNGQVDPLTSQVANCITPTYGIPATVNLATGSVPIAVICRRVEQATTDTDGSKGFSATLDSTVPLREWKYTYTELGQELTATDSLGHTTRRAYYTFTTPDHTAGDLMSVTDRMDHTTNYTVYDGAGRVLEEVDPNGLHTQYFYQAPGRLYAVRKHFHAGQPDEKVWLTQYAYDAEGQLLRITQPDGTAMGFEYDAAHRLTAVYDSLANRIEYDLDEQGNRKVERVKDGAGRLARTLSREMDALNRIQRETIGQ